MSDLLAKEDDLLVPDASTVEEGAGGVLQIKDGGVALAKWASGVLDTDGTLAANSDSKVASQKAVKTYVTAAVAGGSGAPYSELSPADMGLLAWTAPWWLPATEPGGFSMASQEVWTMKFRNPSAQTVTNVVGRLGTAGTSFTGNGAKFAIFSEDGQTRHFVTADISGSLGTTGSKSLAFTGAGSLAAGVFWLAFWASSSGTLPRFSGYGATGLQTGLATSGKQAVQRPHTGQTDMPSTITITASANNAAPWLMGLT